MGMTSSPTITYYEEDEDDTPRLNIVTKKIWVDGQGWVLTKFYNIPNLVRISVVSPLGDGAGTT